MSSKRRTLDLEQVKSFIEADLTFHQLRATLKCSSPMLRKFLADNSLITRHVDSERSERVKALSAQIAENRIPRGKGGDAAFRAALAGRTFSRLAFSVTDAREPIHRPHKAPGDDFSASGSSMRHVAGNTGIHRSASGGRS